MPRIFYLVRKEFLQISRDRMLRAQLVGMPLVQLLIITSAATFDVKEVSVVVQDADRTPLSRRVVESIGRAEQFRTVPAPPLRAEEALVASEAAAVVRIPRGFEEDVRRRSAPRIQALFDGTDGPVAATASGYLNQIVIDAVRRHPAARGGGTGPPGAGPRVELRTRSWYNPENDYDDFMAPGILVILVTVIGSLMTAVNIAREKEIGTLEQLNVTPITRGEFIAGKLIPFWIIGLLELGAGLVLAWLVFRIPFEGSLLLLFGAAGVYLLSALALGLLVSTISETQQQAQFVTFFILLIYLFMSGLFTPVTSMPEWAQWIAEANPMKHFVLLVRAVLLKGAGPLEVGRELLALTAFAVVLLPLAVRTYSKRVG